MRHRQRNDRGITLIEMIVVISMILVLAAIAVPAFIQSGLLGRSGLENSARDLFVLLQASRQYAATYRVDAGVAYAVRESEDSVTGETVPVMDGYMLVRRMTREEFDGLRFLVNDPARLVEGSERADALPFVPVVTKQGVMQTMRSENAVLDRITFATETGQSVAVGVAFANVAGQPVVVGGRDQGLVPIRIYDPEILDSDTPGSPGNTANLVTPRDLSYALYPTIAEANNVGNRALETDWRNYRLPAQVFTPLGELIVDDGLPQKERFRISVGPLPQVIPADRFIDPEAVPNATLVSSNIDLYRSTGRVKLGL